MFRKLLIPVLVVLFVVLQYKLWVGEGSLAEVATLERDIEAQQKAIEEMKRHNMAMQAEIDSFKNDQEAVEARARSDLGMIREGEVYFQIPDKGEKP
ncbi:MAG: septum formation initiator family protein [Gammaproteobacteria bacterium]|nr:septum formation initiator family protein [Gammaproteobacteria bacterium]